MIEFALPPAPRSSDVLFRADDTRGWANACITKRRYWGRGDRPYMEGFRRAAKRLALQVCEEGREQDYLVYPILYCYRHHVELALKSMIGLMLDLAEAEPDQQCKNAMEGHRVDTLWVVCKRYFKHENIKHFGLTIPREDLKGIDSYIRQLHEVDPDSQAFRYDRSKDGTKISIPETVTHINIALIAEYMERLCDQLDGMDFFLAHMRELRDDAQNYYCGWE